MGKGSSLVELTTKKYYTLNMFKHLCIKPSCKKSYESEDVDAYYCEECVLLNKEIAKKIDATHVTVAPVKSDFQNYEELRKRNGVVRPRDIGIIF